jgi:hypothetical protein
MLIFHCETGKRSDFFPTKFLYADWDFTPGHLHSSPPGRDHAGHGYEPHRITLCLFHLASEFRALWTLGNPSPHLCLSCSAPLFGAAT